LTTDPVRLAASSAGNGNCRDEADVRRSGDRHHHDPAWNTIPNALRDQLYGRNPLFNLYFCYGTQH
jgi:hypothetical protein